VWNKNSKKKLCQNNIPKTNVKQIKGDVNYTFIYLTLSKKKFLKKLSTYMWPMSTHVYSCMNYEWIKIQLKMNWKLTKN
jgi:hypothetical protein